MYKLENASFKMDHVDIQNKTIYHIHISLMFKFNDVGYKQKPKI